MKRRNWLSLSRKLVDQYDLDYSFQAVQEYNGEQALSFFGEGVVVTKLYPTPFIIGLSGSLLGGSVGNGLAFDPNGQITRIDPGSTTSKNFVIPTADPSNARWDLLVLRYVAKGDTLIPKPSDPIVNINLNIHDDFALAVIAGTPGGSPAYPAKGQLDIILGGVRVPAGATLGNQCLIDLTIREFAQSNAVVLPSIEQEVPSGIVNGSNKNFTLSEVPVNSESVLVMLDGDVLDPSFYTISGQTVSFVTAPAIAQKPYVYYVVNSSGSVNPIIGKQEVPVQAPNGIIDTFPLVGVPVNQESTIVIVNGGVVDTSKWGLIQSALVSSIKFNAGYVPPIAAKISVFYFTNLYAAGSFSAPVPVNNAANIGSGVAIYDSLASGVLKFRTAVAGTNMSITNDGMGNVVFNASGGGGGGGGALVVLGSPGAGLVINPASGIPVTADQRQLKFVVGQTGQGGQNITANPQIAAGAFVGQELLLKGVSNSDYPILQDGNGVSLNGAIALKAQATIYFVWDGVVWSENSRR